MHSDLFCTAATFAPFFIRSGSGDDVGALVVPVGTLARLEESQAEGLAGRYPPFDAI